MDSKSFDIVFSNEIRLWLMGCLMSFPDFGIIIMAVVLHAFGKYSRRMYPLIDVSQLYDDFPAKCFTYVFLLNLYIY